MELLLQGLRAAGEPTRLRLLFLCAHAELTVTELTQILTQSQPRVSRHLKLLCDAGLVDRYREGTKAYYRLAEQGDCAYLARTLVDLIPGSAQTVERDLERLEGVKQSRAILAAEYFRNNAARWSEIRSLYVSEAEVEAALIDVAGNQKIDDFLDIGTGTGRVLEIMASKVGRGIGIDLSREMLQLARTNLERANCRNCQVRQGDMYNLHLPVGSFDLVVAHQLLHYADEPCLVIEEAARALKPGGRLVVVDFNRHAEIFLQDEQRHRWLGFEEGEVVEWMRGANLNAGPITRLVGDPLTVLIWVGSRQ